ncbi:MAG: alkene reductase [Cyanobacteria bacterium J06641_5]
MNVPTDLFTPVRLGPYELPNRIVMAPMTRLRAIDSIPQPLMAEYYAQRASAGLIVTECTMVDPLSNGYLNCPGIFSAAQISGWQQITAAVRAAGGRIFLQLWHSGPISHPSLLAGQQPVAPSSIAPRGTLHTPMGKVNLETPRALETEEIPEIVAQFARGAENAWAAGFDGIELHGAFGYLIDRFLQDGSNQRSDRYGGMVENRVRFLLEIVDVVTAVWGSDRVGIKLSPSNTFYGMVDANARATFGYVLQALSPKNLAYVHLMEPNEKDLETGKVIPNVLDALGEAYTSTIITNGGYDRDKGNAVLASEKAALVSFGRPFIANSDLPERLRLGVELNTPDVKTFYAPGSEGYTDYPTLAQSK